MRASVIIRSRDEAPRLRLALASLEQQAGLTEVIVVDDGSTDATAEVISKASASLPITALTNRARLGRSAASNRGALAARGDLLIFLDGDTLAGPGMVAAHIGAHASRERLIGRGETWHLRCTRFLSDPETVTFQPAHRERGRDLAERQREAMRVTCAQVRGDFGAIELRASPGIYPGTAPSLLYEREFDALANHPDSPWLWAAASGSNLSVRRADFIQAGGFDPLLDINEHREFAYRLCGGGARMAAVRGARTYHLTHRTGWRDPLIERGWEERFRHRHPEARLSELTAYWASISSGASVSNFFVGQ